MPIGGFAMTEASALEFLGRSERIGCAYGGGQCAEVAICDYLSPYTGTILPCCAGCAPQAFSHGWGWLRSYPLWSIVVSADEGDSAA